MFGNLQGWIAAALVAALTGGLMVWKGTPEGISEPTGALAAAATPVALPADAATLFPAGTEAADAGELYRALAAAVRSHPDAYDRYEKIADRTKALTAATKELGGDLDLLVKAGDRARMTLFAADPAEVVNYANEKPVLPQLQRVGSAAVGVAARMLAPDLARPDKAAPDPARGAALLQAVFRLGRFLAEERVVFDEYRIGVDLMGSAAGTAARFGGVDADRKAALLAFADAVKIKPEYVAVVQTLTGIPADGRRMAAPGDVFDLALNGKEPFWRAEAALKLGRMRWMAGVTLGDQKGATRVLKDLANRPDLPPNVKAAATAARDLTVERFRMIG